MQNRTRHRLVACALTPPLPAIVSTSACLLLWACASQPSSVTPKQAQDAIGLSLPSQYDASRAKESRAPEAWFHFFHSSQLRQLVDQTLAENFTIERARARIAEAEALARQARSRLYPSLQANVFGRRGDGLLAASPVSAGQGPPGAEPPVMTFLTASLAASYEVDAWGANRLEARAADHAALASRQRLQSLAMTTAANVTNIWIRLIEAQQELDLQNRQIAALQESLELAELRLGLGQAPALNVVQQEQRVQALQSLRELTLSRQQSLRHQLAALLGKVPQHFDPPRLPPDYPTLSDLPPTGVPADLLQRRPDLQAALSSLAAADARAAAAFRSTLPQLRLSAELLNQSDSLSSLLDRVLWSAGASLSDTLFASGAEKARSQAAQARYEQSLAEVRQALLNALQDVSDALDRSYRLHNYRIGVEEQLESAEEAYRLAELNYRNGLIDYQRLLDSLVSMQELQREVLAARRQELENRVSLHRALGGAWPEDLLSRLTLNPPSHRRFPPIRLP